MSENAHPFLAEASVDGDSVSVAGPLARYRAAVADGRVTFDPLQQAVVERLESLHFALAGYRPLTEPPSRWTSWFMKEKRVPMPRGLYLHGRFGRGKSMLMDLFFAGAPIQPRRRVHFHAFMAEIHDRLHVFRQKTKGTVADPLPQVAAEVAERAWLLCFDEFVVNDIADAMILGRLFQALMDAGVVVVATSNFAPDDLYLDGLQRERFLPFIKVLRDQLDVLTLDGPTDYRRARLAGRQVYFHPDTHDSRAAMNDLWHELIGDQTPQPAELLVRGRRLHIPQAVEGYARFRFVDLCDRPLGASDYLAIAAKYPTILVDGVPELGPQNHNEARRFITMIDAFYEAKTKLVLTAAAPPDTLYPHGKGAFEFQRTASRLMEMQAADYLDRPTAGSPA